MHQAEVELRTLIQMLLNKTSSVLMMLLLQPDEFGPTLVSSAEGVKTIFTALLDTLDKKS